MSAPLARSSPLSPARLGKVGCALKGMPKEDGENVECESTIFIKEGKAGKAGGSEGRRDGGSGAGSNNICSFFFRQRNTT